MEIIKVSATSPASAVARAISSVIHEYRCAEVEAIGAEAVNQAVHALTLATGYLKHEGISVAFVPQRKTVVIENKHRTLIKFIVASRIASSRISISPSNPSMKATLPRV